MRQVLWGIMLLCGVIGVMPARGQGTTTSDWAWRPLLEVDGVEFTYIFYSEADNYNDGIVVKLANKNEYAVSYRFKIVIRTDGDAFIQDVEGVLAAGEVKTGDSAGLFWVPFKDGRSISEVGLRGYRITRSEEPTPAPAGGETGEAV